MPLVKHGMKAVSLLRSASTYGQSVRGSTLLLPGEDSGRPRKRSCGGVSTAEPGKDKGKRFDLLALVWSLFIRWAKTFPLNVSHIPSSKSDPLHFLEYPPQLC